MKAPTMLCAPGKKHELARKDAQSPRIQESCERFFSQVTAEWSRDIHFPHALSRPSPDLHLKALHVPWPNNLMSYCTSIPKDTDAIPSARLGLIRDVDDHGLDSRFVTLSVL